MAVAHDGNQEEDAMQVISEKGLKRLVEDLKAR